MSNERAKILQMVADGTITPEDAEKLMNALDNGGNGEAATAIGVAERGPLKYLRVVVDGGDDQINIRVPIQLIRTGIKLTTLMPSNASEQLNEHGIDLSQFNSLDGEELIEALRELHVEVDSGDGEKIRVFCE